MVRQIKIIFINQPSDADKVNEFIRTISSSRFYGIKSNSKYVMILYEADMKQINLKW